MDRLDQQGSRAVGLQVPIGEMGLVVLTAERARETGGDGECFDVISTIINTDNTRSISMLMVDDKGDDHSFIISVYSTLTRTTYFLYDFYR